MHLHGCLVRLYGMRENGIITIAIKVVVFHFHGCRPSLPRESRGRGYRMRTLEGDPSGLLRIVVLFNALLKRLVERFATSLSDELGEVHKRILVRSKASLTS
jgi:hypothetical protein